MDEGEDDHVVVAGNSLDGYALPMMPMMGAEMEATHGEAAAAMQAQAQAMPAM
jgi:hypothetical protein